MTIIAGTPKQVLQAEELLFRMMGWHGNDRIVYMYWTLDKKNILLKKLLISAEENTEYANMYADMCVGDMMKMTSSPTGGITHLDCGDDFDVELEKLCEV